MSAKKRQSSDTGLLKARFSIGAKLIIIVSVIVLVSLGSITALVSWLVREDVKINAEENNFDINRRAAAETEQTLENMRSLSLMFIRAAAALGEQNTLVQKEAGFFFTQNPQIASLFYTSAGLTGQADQVLFNERFFLSRGIDVSLARSFRANNTRNLERAAAGQTIILNVSPVFKTPLAAMFFQAEGRGGCILFSTESLNESFGLGANASYLINADGDIIADADPDTVKSALNIADRDYIIRILNSSDQNQQMTIEIQSENMTNKPLTIPLLNNVKQNLQPAIDTVYIFSRQAVDIVCEFFRNFINSVFKYLNIDRKINARTKDTANITRYYLAYTRLNTAGCIVITSVGHDKVFEVINAVTRFNLCLTASVLFVSIMLIGFYAKSISIPLKALADAARTIEGGSFDIELKPKGHDEIGVLTSNFGRMCAALGVFGKFTNRGIAVQTMRGDIKPGGLLKHATVFFLDIWEFAEKSGNFTRAFGDDASNHIVYWLNDYLTQMVECVEKTNGVVDKFIGDTVMAHWGAAFTAGSPRADAFNCIKAALMMRLALMKMNMNRKNDNWGNPPIHAGCGINTGIVTAGQIGSDLRREYTVIGDPVNLASRVKALNKHFGTDILITEDTWNLVKDQLIVEEMPSVTLKGKEKPVRLFAVVNLISILSGPGTLAEVRSLLGIKPADTLKVQV